MRSKSRVWVLPSVFALLAVSIPVQMVVKEHFGEPYPGLFQPAFSAFEQPHGTISLTVVKITVDGKGIDEADLFPAGNTVQRLTLLKSIFPTHQADGVMDDDLRSRLRSNLVHSLGATPHVLSVAWERSRYRLASGSMTREGILAEYRIDFSGDQS
jgi:hypothetical protein